MCGLELQGIRKRFFDVLLNGRIDTVVASLGAGLAAGITRVVMVLSGRASLDLSGTGDLDLLDEGFSGFEFWHMRVSSALLVIPER